MGDKNQLKWVQDNFHLIQPPILEIGSRHYDPGTAIDYRGLCQGMEFIGVDMSAGDNVDIAIDLTQDLSVIEEKLGKKKFKTIICCSVLEHVNNLFKMAENISFLLEEGGVLLVSVPFSWRFHGYPNDYWRFTPEGIKCLFPEFLFKQDLSIMASINIEDMEKLAENHQDFNSFVTYPIKPIKIKQPKSKIKKIINKVMNKLKINPTLQIPPLPTYPYVLAPINIMMVGIKKSNN